jgi:hypothetical protein
MTFLMSLLVFLHLVGAAALVGGWFATFRTPTVTVWQLAGAIVQLVTGLALVGILGATHETVNYVKITVKLVLAVVVSGAAFVGYGRAVRDEQVPVGIAHAVGGLALVNIGVAALWQ